MPAAQGIFIISITLHTSNCKSLCTALRSRASSRGIHGPEVPGVAGVQVFPALLARFREREETVKGDVFATFITLLEQVEWLIPSK